ncbi:MAG: DUF4340 domain-containing protein [Planctomycetota bacterium]
MNETIKTAAFAGAAALAVAAAVVTQPTSGNYNVADQIGKDLAKPFELDEAKRLTIVAYDEKNATLNTFEVAETDGLWTLPSKGGYPADAADQLAAAVNGVAGRKVLQIASDDAKDHAEFGVIDPNAEELAGRSGVGARVSLATADGKPLADLIIGNEVKDQEDQRYVRRADQDVTYVAKIDPEDFSTNFADWIEDDLLKISPWDIRRVRLRDYSAEMFMTLQGMAVDPTFRTDTTLDYDDNDSKWRLAEYLTAPDARRDAFVAAELGADKQLDQDKLQDLKNALDDLRIVDVASKPEGFSADLKAGEDFMNNREALASLMARGFAPTRSERGDIEILSSEGEVICTMKDGVEYVLRFGNLLLGKEEDGGQEDGQDRAAGGDQDAAAAAAEAEDGDGKAGINRYLFVLARLNEAAIDKPELEEVPPLPEGADKPADAADDAADGAAGDEAEDAGNAEGTEPTELEQAVEARKAVEERNARLLDEYQDKLAAARERVAELNERFGDWYYVISNEVFEKVHLSIDDITKEKAADDDTAADAGADPNASAFGAAGGAVPGIPAIDSLMGEQPADTPAPEAGSSSSSAEATEDGEAARAETSDAGTSDAGTSDAGSSDAGAPDAEAPAPDVQDLQETAKDSSPAGEQPPAEQAPAGEPAPG